MNILQINSVCGIGSTGRIATDIHATLISKGHESIIAYGRESTRGCEQAIRVGNKLDHYLHFARTRLLDEQGFGSKSGTKKFILKIRKIKPDVIHLHNLHGYYLHIGLLFDYLKKAKIPIIWTLHDCWAFTGHCSHFDFYGCDRWKTQCHDCPLKSNYPKSLFLDRSKKNYKQKKALFTGVQKLTVVTPSRWLAGLVKESFLEEYPVETINNGIDLNVFQPRASKFRESYKLEGQYILLGVASFWDELKGYPYFLDLAKQLKPDEKIVLVGLNAKQIRDLPAGIIGIAKTNSPADLAEIYSAADLFVNPTLEDNFPTTNLEALACGTPVVTFNSGGSPECLDADCGMVVERGNLAGVLDAISTMRLVGKAAYSANCQKRVREYFDKDARFAEYIELYKSCLD